MLFLNMICGLSLAFEHCIKTWLSSVSGLLSMNHQKIKSLNFNEVNCPLMIVFKNLIFFHGGLFQRVDTPLKNVGVILVAKI